MAPREFDPPRHQAGRAERARMLRATEGRAADAAFGKDDALVEALVGEDPLAAHRLLEMAHSFVKEAAIHDSYIVAEIARRTRDEIGRGRRGVGEGAVGLG